MSELIAKIVRQASGDYSLRWEKWSSLYQNSVMVDSVGIFGDIFDGDKCEVCFLKGGTRLTEPFDIPLLKRTVNGIETDMYYTDIPNGVMQHSGTITLSVGIKRPYGHGYTYRTHQLLDFDIESTGGTDKTPITQTQAEIFAAQLEAFKREVEELHMQGCTVTVGGERQEYFNADTKADVTQLTSLAQAFVNSQAELVGKIKQHSTRMKVVNNKQETQSLSNGDFYFIKI